MEKLCVAKPVKMITVIVDRGKSKKVVKILNEYSLGCQFATYGRGSASTDIQSYFGLEDSKRDVVFSVVPNEKIKEVMEKIKEKLHLHKPNTGIAFTIPLKCVSSVLALKYMLNEVER